ncbi:hypothetical protein GYMLUDRAFT_235943 [Collybiopsis luxurians FD-317 M1]|nr:hypothetical protein GYMLUDRAFT_235943 [Collybiopsis luxurians FD-317 M1]
MEFDDPGQVLETWSHPKGAPVAAQVYPNIADLMASKKWIGFGSPQSNYYCTYCKSHRENIDDLNYKSYIPRDAATVHNQATQWRESVTIDQKQKLHTQTGIQYSPILEIPYFDPVKHTVLGIMHNRLEGDLQYHLQVLWGIGRPDNQQKAGAKEMADLQQMETEDEGEYSEADTEEAGSELEELKNETARAASTSGLDNHMQDINLNNGETTPTGSYFPPVGSLASLSLQARDWDLVEVDNEDNLDYIPKSTELFDFTTEQLGQIRQCIWDICLPTWVERPPINLGEKEHGKLKAHEYLVLFTRKGI